MDRKFYASLEAARLLKEKGYDRECIAYYQNDEFHPYAFSRYDLSINDKNAAPPYMNQYSAPTKSEAIDWLESKGIGISIIFCEIDMYEYVVESKDCYYSVVESGYKETRLEAEEAAIVKACELL